MKNGNKPIPPAKLFIVTYPDNTFAGWTTRVMHRCIARCFKTAAEASNYDKQTSPGYPGSVEELI
jgi:hypothetical protein